MTAGCSSPRREGLVLTDTNGVKDAYEWDGGLQVGKLSTGGGVDDSELLSASADGKDAFFFTRDVLVPRTKTASAIKIYDAREGGGYPVKPDTAALRRVGRVPRRRLRRRRRRRTSTRCRRRRCRKRRS